MVKDKFIIYTGLYESIRGTKKVLIVHQSGFYGNKYFLCYINNTNKKLTKKTILELVDLKYGGYSSILLSVVKKVSKLYEVVW